MVPFGQDSIPPMAGKTTNCRMSCDCFNVACTQGIEAFNLLNFFLFNLDQRITCKNF